MNLEDVERQLHDRLDALGPAPRAELLRVLLLPDFDGAWGNCRERGVSRSLVQGNLAHELREERGGDEQATDQGPHPFTTTLRFVPLSRQEGLRAPRKKEPSREPEDQSQVVEAATDARGK